MQTVLQVICKNTLEPKHPCIKELFSVLLTVFCLHLSHDMNSVIISSLYRLNWISIKDINTTTFNHCTGKYECTQQTKRDDEGE